VRASTSVLVAAPLLGLLALTLLVPGAARADPDGPSVGLSPDGGRWADSLEGPLFSTALRWVPGDRRSASWWVRNESRDRARLSVELPEDAVLPGWLALSTRVDDGWTSVADGGPGVVGVLAPGEERRVDLRVAMRPAAGNASERETADLRLRVRLTEEVPGTGPGDETDPEVTDPDLTDPDGTAPSGTGPDEVADDGSDGLLPGTGSELGLGFLLLAVLMVGLGIALLRRRVRDVAEEPVASARVLEEVAP